VVPKVSVRYRSLSYILTVLTTALVIMATARTAISLSWAANVSVAETSQRIFSFSRRKSPSAIHRVRNF